MLRLKNIPSKYHTSKKRALTPAEQLAKLERNREYSKYQDKFRQQLTLLKLPKWVEEHRFHHTRKWRFDFAWPQFLIAVEIEGGIWLRDENGQRGTKGHGFPTKFEKDCEKYAEAAILDWYVLRVCGKHINNMQAISWLQRRIERQIQMGKYHKQDLFN